MTSTSDDNRSMLCPGCGHDVPADRYCVRCGSRLRGPAAGRSGGRRHEFAAAPDESHLVPRVISTLFPQLPRASMFAFRAAFAVGVAVVVVLGLAGLFPLAVVASALLVPLLTILYLYDVDVYEDEPLRVLGATIAWGAAAGAVYGVVVRVVTPAGVDAVLESPERTLLVSGLLLPLLATTLMLLGPLALLPYRRFNDVLDGATFGAASAVVFAGAALLVHSTPLLSAGVRPAGAVEPWVVRLLELTVALPLIAAGAVGAAAASLWLRYRAPLADRQALGVLGLPALAVPLAAAALVLAAMAQIRLPDESSIVVLAVLAAGALLWLRHVIHVGLLQEAAEIPIGPETVCANCGETTRRHTFCSSCGIAFRALPKEPVARQARGAESPRST